jgi:hypothetical protein
MPYELLSGDIKDVSDRTLRVVINEFRRLARQRQWQIVVPMHCQPVVEWWADALVLKGDLSEADLDEAKSPTWSPEGWEYIHPTQDAEGKKIELEMGTTSRSRIAGGRGDDIEEIDAERSDDLKRSKQLGLEPPPPPAPGAAPAGPPKPTPKPQPTALEEGMVSIAKAAVERQEPNVVEAIAPVIAEMMRSNAEMMERALRTFGEQMQMARVAQSADLERTLQTMALAVSRPTEVVNNVAPTPVHMHVEPTPLNIENKVEPTPVHMHVEPTPLQVTNNVEVSEVAITSMPARETTTTVARDAQGEIVDTKTVERDATKPKKD